MSEYVFIKGNEVVAEAACRAGADIFCGYPITPSSEFLEYMSRRLPELGKRFIQAESEVAAAAMIQAAAIGGGRAVTATSGPGLSLMAETLNNMAMTRLPGVFVDVQRAAGNITPEQSDYNYVTKSLGHNGLRGLVYAPASLQESVDIMYMAFDKAEACQTPVFIMLDGMLGQMEEPVRLPEFKKREKPLPYLVPSGCRERKPTLFLAQPMAEYPGDTGEDAMERARMKSYEDYRKWVDTEVLYDTYLMEDAEYVFISYGSSARILRDAVRILRSRDIKAGLFRAITVFPFPEKQIQAIRAKAVLTVEMAMPPMFHDDVRLHLSRDIPIAFYNRCGGNMVNEVEAAEKMCEWIERIG